MGKPATRVCFRADKRGDFKGDVTAVFGDAPDGPGMLTRYAHIGQHSACSREWVTQDTRPALPHEFKALKNELTQIGYKLACLRTLPPMKG